MDNKLERTMELSRDPMLLVENGKLQLMNTAARMLFRSTLPGDPAVKILPDSILSEPSESFFTSLNVQNTRYTVSALRDGEGLLLSLAADPDTFRIRGYLSDSLLTGMLSSLCNLKLAADRIGNGQGGDNGKERLFRSILMHNYYILNRRLSNLSFLCAMQENNVLILPRRADLRALCSGIAENVNDALGSGHPHVELVVPEEPVSAWVDTPKIEQLLLNLLSNSLIHTPEEGSIRLRLSCSGENAVLAVDDTGTGIPRELLNTVFCGYQNRMDEHNLSNPGNGGLGLAICRCIAEKHGGTLIIESRPGEGTSVRLLLPITPPVTDRLESGRKEYEFGGSTAVLTELCDVLNADAYAPAFLD